MKEIKIILSNRDGLHARPAAVFVESAGRFASDIIVVKNGRGVDGKSILAILTLAVEFGEEITLQVAGSDEEQAFHYLLEVITQGLGETKNV